MTINDFYTNGANNCALFNYVYCCNKSDLGNGDYESGDGARFLGRGYFHLTGRKNYTKLLYEPWKIKYPDDKRSIEQIMDLLETDIDLTIKISMVFWESKGINAKIKSTTYSESEVSSVSKKVNGGQIGLDERKSNTKKAYEFLGKKQLNR